MQVFHTAGEPPSSGSSRRATSGCTRNNSAALRNSVAVNSDGMAAMDGVSQCKKPTARCRGLFMVNPAGGNRRPGAWGGCGRIGGGIFTAENAEEERKE